METLFTSITKYFEGIVDQFPSKEWDEALGQEPEALVQYLHQYIQTHSHHAKKLCSSYNFELFDVLYNLSTQHDTLWECTAHISMREVVHTMYISLRKREFSLMLLDRLVCCTHTSTYHLLLHAAQLYLVEEDNVGEHCKGRNEKV